MSNLKLLRVMVIKEFRTTFRERSQIRALLISVGLMVLVAGNTFYQVSRNSPGRRSRPGISQIVEHAFIPSTHDIWQARWLAILGTVGVGFFFSMGYLMSAVLACFVGEKEARTLEILLASPLSNDKLFIAKSTSVLLPSACIGGLFTLAIAILVTLFGSGHVLNVPAVQIFIGLTMGIPALLMLQLWFVGLGAAISAHAETMKGAGQSLGGAITLLIFGSAYGMPLLWGAIPSIHAPVLAFVRQLLTFPFVAQYGIFLLALAIPAFLLMSLGRAFFRRDRMLT